jgi:transcriptional regulator with XRE-family HTH domain
MSAKSEDPVMRRVRDLFDKSGMSLDDLGQKMGSEGPTARKSAWQFLNKVDDPRIGTLRKFAKALGVPLEELLAANKKTRSK